MKITLEYRNPTPSHCDVAVFVNGALAGVLTLQQNEVVSFDQILHYGASGYPGDSLVSKGKSLPEEPTTPGGSRFGA